MSNVIDRRLNPKDKAIKNRQKFIQRSRAQIKEAVKESISSGNIADIEKGKVKVKLKGIGEPTFTTDSKTGDKKYILPGNDKYIVGDKQAKPNDEEGEGGKEGGLGRGEDDFEFVLTNDEYLDFIFEDLELPDLIKKQMKDVTKLKPKRAGYTNTGNPSQLDVVRSLKNSLGRRIGLKRPNDEEIEKLEEELKQAEKEWEENDDLSLAKGHGVRIFELRSKIEELKNRQVAVPWLDPFDVRYRNFTQVPQPMTQAVMFCVMDVSGSMGQREKDLAKRFFFLLHMFLKRKYEKVDLIFVKHHEEAFEVDEFDFFHSRESGGTVVSTSLKLTKKIIDERYNVNDWNVYVAQVSDGDNYADDNPEVVNTMALLLPLVQYYAYVEIRSPYYARPSSGLWKIYQQITKVFTNLKTKDVGQVNDIWKVFKELFTKGIT